MLLHVVLFRPRPDLDAAAVSGLVGSIETAAREIPVVRRFWVGSRVAQAPAYLAAGAFPDFPYAAVVELADRAALDVYLAHPAHQALGRAFNSSLAATLIYDYEVQDARDGLERLAP